MSAPDGSTDDPTASSVLDGPTASSGLEDARREAMRDFLLRYIERRRRRSRLLLFGGGGLLLAGALSGSIAAVVLAPDDVQQRQVWCYEAASVSSPVAHGELDASSDVATPVSNAVDMCTFFWQQGILSSHAGDRTTTSGARGGTTDDVSTGTGTGASDGADVDTRDSAGTDADTGASAGTDTGAGTDTTASADADTTAGPDMRNGAHTGGSADARTGSPAATSPAAAAPGAASSDAASSAAVPPLVACLRNDQTIAVFPSTHALAQGTLTDARFCGSLGLSETHSR